MTRARTGVLAATLFLAAGMLALFLVLLTGRSSGSGPGFVPKLGGESGDTPGEVASREGPTSYEAYMSAARAYPAKTIPPAVVARAKATFNRIAKADARRLRHGRHFLGDGSRWRLYGPRVNATQPGVISFSGATNNTASRVTAMVADPDCTAKHCRLWVGVSGGGVWRTDNAVAGNPEWQQVSPDDLDQNSVGTLTLAPGKKHDTLYLGTGEANRCSSGCESGVGVYKSIDGGHHWKKLADTCVSNATYACATPGKDAFLGRGINSIVIDPRDASHILVGSALGVRGLSHVVRMSPACTSRMTVERRSRRSGTARSPTAPSHEPTRATRAQAG
jgi:hypothetical protein